MSVSGSAAMAVMRLCKPKKSAYADIEKSKKKADKENAAGRDFALPKDRKASYTLVPGTEFPCMIVRSNKKAAPAQDKAVLFLYGGVTRLWKMQLRFAVDLANRTGLPVWYPVYPSVTETPITRAIEVLYQVYRRMTEQHKPEKIAVVGLSFGGTFALELINWNNRSEEPVPMPGLIIAHSPGGIPDAAEDWAEMARYEKRDPIFFVEDIRAMLRLIPEAAQTPAHALSPRREDFHGAPETHMYYGEEVLAGNAPAYRWAFEQAGVGDRLHITITENMMHGYSCMPVFPESRKSYTEALKLIEAL